MPHSRKARRSLDEGWPPHLVQACYDQRRYALGLRDGMVLHVSGVEKINARWVRVYNASGANHEKAFSFSGSLDIRVADVVWMVNEGKDTHAAQ